MVLKITCTQVVHRLQMNHLEKNKVAEGFSLFANEEDFQRRLWLLNMHLERKSMKYR